MSTVENVDVNKPIEKGVTHICYLFCFFLSSFLFFLLLLLSSFLLLPSFLLFDSSNIV